MLGREGCLTGNRRSPCMYQWDRTSRAHLVKKPHFMWGKRRAAEGKIIGPRSCGKTETKPT